MAGELSLAVIVMTTPTAAKAACFRYEGSVAGFISLGVLCLPSRVRNRLE